MAQLPKELLELENIVTLGTVDQHGEFGFLEAAFAGDGWRVATYLKDCHSIGIWDTSTGSLRSQLPVGECLKRCLPFKETSIRSNCPQAFALNRDGTLAAVGFLSTDVFLVEVSTGQIIRSFQRPPDAYPDRYGQLYSRYAGGAPGVHRITFSQDDTLIAIAYDYRLIGVWRIEVEQPIARLQPSYAAKTTTFLGGLTQTIRFSEDNRYLFTAELGGVAAIWEWHTGELVLDGSQHVDEVISIDECQGAVRWATQTGHVWAATDTEAPRCLLDADTNWREALFTLDGNHVVAAIYTPYVESRYAYRFENARSFDAVTRDEASQHTLNTLMHHHQTGAIKHGCHILLPHPADRKRFSNNDVIEVQWDGNDQISADVLYVDQQQRHLLQICEGGKELRLWDFQTLNFLQAITLEHPCLALSFSRDGAWLIMYPRNWTAR